MKRRSFITGVAALAAYSQLERASALSPQQRTLLFNKVRNRLFGVNMSGAEFSTPNFPSQSDWVYLAAQGVTFVRLPVAWENLLTTVGGATLASTYTANLKTAIAGAHAVGIGVIVDLHNFGAYTAAAQWGSTVTYAGNSGTPATGVSFLGNGITSANFANIWTLLSTALVGTPGLIGYGLMNEVSNNIVGVNLLIPANYFASALTTWAAGSGVTLTQQAPGTNPLGSTYGPVWQVGVTTAFTGFSQTLTFANVAYDVSCYAKTVSGSTAMQIYVGGNGSGVKTLTGSFQRFDFTATPTAGSSFSGVFLEAAGTFQVANVQMNLGGTASTYEPSRYIPFAQAAINAIRAVDTATPIYVCGMQFGTASYWQAFNYELAQLTGGNLIFEAHQYFDGPEGIGGGGTYSGSYTSYSIDSASGTTAVAVFTNWLTATGVKGFLGELQVPNNGTDNNAAWLPLQKNVFNALLSSRIPATMWSYRNSGSDPSHTDPLNVAPQSGINDPRLIQMLATH